MKVNYNCLNKESFTLFVRMGGKKKGGKKGKGGDEDRYDPAQMNLILAAQVQSLKERLVLEKERKDKS